MFLQLEKSPTANDVREAFAGDSAFVVHGIEDGPSPVGAVGTHGVHIGRIQDHAAQPGLIAVWAVADNLRIAASNAIRTAENIMKAYEECISATSTDHAPWYIVPADDKRNARVIISKAVSDCLASLPLSYPVLDEERQKELKALRKLLKE